VRCTKEEDESIQELLELADLRLLLLLNFAAGDHELCSVEEVLDDWFIAEEEERVEEESHSFVHEKDLISIQVRDLALQEMLRRVISSQDLLQNEGEHVDSACRLREEEAASLVGDVEEDHGQLLQAALLDVEVLLRGLEDVYDVLDAKGGEVKVRIYQLQVLVDTARWLPEIDAVHQDVFSMLFGGVQAHRSPDDVGSELSLVRLA